MRHDPHTRWFVVAGIALILAGCSHRGDATPPSNATISAPAVTTTSQTSTAPQSTQPGSTDPQSASTSPKGSAAPTGPVVVEVSGGPLPSAVSKAYSVNGGDMVDPTEWDRRFGPGPLPAVSGDGVVLVEALRRFEQNPSGWVRTDEASWLAMSNKDRDALIAELAAATGVTGQAKRSETNEPGANCVLDTYPTVDGVVWQVHGCSYEQLPQFVAVGVARSAPTTDEPTSVDSTVAALADMTDGQVIFTEVRLGEPGADGSTLHLSTQMATTVRSDVAASAVAGPLAGWQTFPGDGSVLFSGPTGATWTIGDEIAVFNWAGRW